MVVREKLSEMVALNADVVGYSRLMADDFDATAATMTEYRSLVEEALAEAGGTLANFVGDSFMAVFDDAKDAVRTAISITEQIEARNADVESVRQVRFRMGIDQGEVSVSDGNWEGDALNIAARIQAKATPGGVSVSGRVYRSLDEPALRFKTIGRHQLKNIPESVEIFQFTDLPTDLTSHTQPSNLALEAPTLAVLPIHTEGADDEMRAAAGIIRADLVHRLAGVPQLRIVDARLSPDGPPEATARYMLESGVHQLGKVVRLYAMLFDVTTMNVVKSHKWTVARDEVLALSEELADEVARSVEVELVVGAPSGLYADLDDPEAIEKVYLGWYHLRSETPEGWTRAIDLFGQVAESHPDQPYGPVLLAFANFTGASLGLTTKRQEALEAAREQARLGDEIGDPTGMAKTVDAAVLMSMGEADRRWLPWRKSRSFARPAT